MATVLVAGIVAHLVRGVRPPFPSLHTTFADTRQVKTIFVCGARQELVAAVGERYRVEHRRETADLG